jgi:hypothetical protein
MRRASWKLLAVSVCTCGALSLLLPDGTMTRVVAQKKDPKKKDPDLTRYLKQLQAKFEAWDKNNDNALDKSELAKAFRGAKAKAYDYQEGGAATPATRTVRPVSVMLAALPRPGLPANLVLAEFFTERKPTKITPPPVNYNTLGDYQLLVVAGTKGKERITKQEFDAWAKKYARLVDDHEDAEKQLAQAKAKFAKAKTPQLKKQAEAELKRHFQEFDNAHRQLLAIPPAIHKALNIVKL